MCAPIVATASPHYCSKKVEFYEHEIPQTEKDEEFGMGCFLFW